MVKCFNCGKWIKPWHEVCTNCGKGQRGPDELKEIIQERRKKLNANFVYSKENVEKIISLNEVFRKKMEALYDGAFELQELFLNLQEQGMKEFFEFKIDGYLKRKKRFKLTPIADERIAKIIDFRFKLNDPKIKFSIDYNTTNAFEWYAKSKTNFLAVVKRQGVFANPAFENLKLCSAMDIIFNKQDFLSIEDALYLSGDEWSLDYEIKTSQNLWHRDEKLWAKRVFETKCKNGDRQLPFYKYCPSCGVPMVESHLEKIVYRHWNEFYYKKIDWNYENKMKLFQMNDKITDLYRTSVDEMFKMKKIFKYEFASGKKYFNHFFIEAKLIYRNSNPYPMVDKKTAAAIQELFNDDIGLGGFGQLAYIYDYENPGCELEHLNGMPFSGSIWNEGNLDKSFIGEHPINYFVFEMCENICPITLFDMLYMNVDDFCIQYEIYSEEEKWPKGEV